MSAGSEFIFVGCKMPNGIWLNLDAYEVVSKEHGIVRREEGRKVQLKGNAVAFGKPDLSIDGYVFTKVDREFWDKWLETHADSPLLKDNLIKAAKSEGDKKSVSREMEKEPGQFDRLDTSPKGSGIRDPRAPGVKVQPYAKDEDRAAA